MTVKGEDMYEIQTASCVEDVENGCLRPSNGGMFTAVNALRVLEGGNGGTMSCKGKGNFGVSHIKANNQWLRDKLKIK